MRVLFILNPAAGSSGLWKRFASGPMPSEWSARMTERRGHAGELAAAALQEGFSRVVAVGGDGTLSETADGLLSAGPLPEGFALGHFPAGSGCDFARHFGMPRDPARWRALLSEGVVKRIDAGLAVWSEGGVERRRHFVNIAMAGVAGDIVWAMESFGKPLGGTLSYLAVSLASLLRDRAKPVTLSLDGDRRAEAPYHLLALANTKTTGGGMRIAPGADASDGRLDFVAVRGMGKAKLLWSFPKIYAGTHLRVPGVESARVLTLAAESPELVRLNLDGEPLGRLPARFSILPKALPLLLPK